MYRRIPLCWVVLVLQTAVPFMSPTGSLALKRPNKIKKTPGGIYILPTSHTVSTKSLRSSSRVCGNVFTLLPGEDRIITSTETKNGVACRTTFVGEQTNLAISCPKFHLHNKGCSKEFFDVDGGSGNQRYCKENSPNFKSSGKSLTIFYNRKKSKRRKCSYGFICRIYSLPVEEEESKTEAVQEPLIGVPPSGRSFCKVCGWSENYKDGKHSQTKFTFMTLGKKKRKKKKKQKRSTKKNEKKKKKIRNNDGKKRRKEKGKRYSKNHRYYKRKRMMKLRNKKPKRKRVPIDETRIVGGHEAEPGEYPWAVALVKVSGENKDFAGLCGGSLISASWIVSAAHCFSYMSESTSVVATIGTVDFPNSPEGLQKIIQVVIHPEYNPWEDFGNDIALLRLEETVVFTSLVIPVCVATPEDDPLPTNTTVVAGWGHTESNGVRSSTLRAVSIEAIALERCQELYEDTYTITDAMLCAYSPGRDACQGDSGGGLVKLSPEGRWVLVGVVSFGKGCAEPNAPGVYTRISSFVEWIRSTIGHDTCG